MSQIQELINRVNELTKQVGDQRQVIEKMSKSRVEQDKSAIELFAGVKNKAFVVGRDGVARGFGDQNGYMPRAMKSCGSEFGEFLLNVARMGGYERDSVNPTTVLKNLEGMGSKMVTKTALAEGGGATGGYTVPPQWVTELIRIANEESFLRKLCRTIPMTGRNAFIPTLDQTKAPPTGGSSFYGGLVWTWQPEGSNYQTNAETEPTFRQVELVARDLVGIVRASNQLLQDNAVALETVLTTIFTEAMGWAYDYFILNGTGGNQPYGMLNANAAIPVTKQVSAHVTLGDLGAMMSRMLPNSYKNCIWALHPSVLPELITMTTANTSTQLNFLVWLNPVYSGTDGGPAAHMIPGTILGRPFYITEKLPKLAASATGSIALLDPTRHLVGDRMALQVEASPYPNFVSNQMTWRIIARWDAQPELNAAITLADGVFTVSPIVLLNT